MKRIRRPRRCPRTLSLDCSGESKHGEHFPVLLQEVISNLITNKDGIYVDATFGRGGHSREILSAINVAGNLLCIDKDPEAIAVAEQLHDPRVIVRQGSFIHLKEWVQELNWVDKVSGILLDLGVSSPQLDDSSRGFSFMHDGPLDMRMDTMQSLTAAQWINRAREAEIAAVLKEYGEERFAKRIARAIVMARTIAPITTTGQLAEIVTKANPQWEVHKHPATRTFQAVRIMVNNELQELQKFLVGCLDVLAVGGRLAVITFHSLEDRIVKEFITINTQGNLPAKLPIRHEQVVQRIRVVVRNLHASDAEININPRARSAKLWVVEKIK